MLRFTSNAAPSDIAWHELGVDLVLECTGKFTAPGAIQGHLLGAVRRVIVAAPIDVVGVPIIVMGINEQTYDPQRHVIVATASGATNCLAPILKVMHEAIGERHGQITTLHNTTHAGLGMSASGRIRRPAGSMILSLTATADDDAAQRTGNAGRMLAAENNADPAAAKVPGCAPMAADNEISIGLIYPELRGKISGRAVEVPMLNAALTDCTFELRRSSSAEEVNILFAQAARTTLVGILGYEAQQRASVAYACDTRSCIVDGTATLVNDGTMLKVFAWHDNELGYACRLVDLACHMRSGGI